MAFLSGAGKSVLSEIGKSPKVAFGLFVVLALGGLINLIGFASPDWTRLRAYYSPRKPGLIYMYSGLWQICQELDGTSYRTVCDPMYFRRGWYAAVQAMMIFGLLASIAAGGLLLMFLFSSRFKQRNIVIIILVACIAAATFNVIGVSVFAANSRRTLQWAFYLCCVGTGLFGLCSILAGLLLWQERTLSKH